MGLDATLNSGSGFDGFIGELGWTGAIRKLMKLSSSFEKSQVGFCSVSSTSESESSIKDGTLLVIERSSVALVGRWTGKFTDSVDDDSESSRGRDSKDVSTDREDILIVEELSGLFIFSSSNDTNELDDRS
eukprot:scaffold29919_cov70-Cyclotella_meneghiniana.AAC.1